MGKKTKQQPSREKVALEALRQGGALLRKGLEVKLLYPDGKKEVLSRSEEKSQVWSDALRALEARSSKVDNNTTNTSDNEKPKDSLVIYSDGGSRGNPGQSAAGYVILTSDESHTLERGGKYLGITTNNQAEYQAVKLALESAIKFDANNVKVYVDSLLVANQLNGVFKVKNKELWPVHEAIKQLAEKFDDITFTHVKREHNQLADDEVNKILDSQEAD